MNTLMTKIQLDADILSVTCIINGSVRKEDVVPELMNRSDWFAAKFYAISEGWIDKDPTGPSKRGSRYIPSSPTDLQLSEADIFEQMGLSAFDYAADQHSMMVNDMMQSNPGKSFNAWDLRRGREGPCTKATWPYVRDGLMRKQEIDIEGNRRGRTYTFIPIQWRLEERVLELEGVLASVTSALLGHPPIGVEAQ
jgi:hypothetical protein